MTSLNSKLQLAMLNRKKGRNLLEKGFTLVELLVVVIIVGILSSVALPAFLNQSNKAKVAAAKALVSSGAKECQVHLVDGAGAIDITTSGSDGILFPAENATGAAITGTVIKTTPALNCEIGTGGTFAASIEGLGYQTFIAQVNGSGVISKECIAGTNGEIDGCDSNTVTTNDNNTPNDTSDDTTVTTITW